MLPGKRLILNERIRATQVLLVDEQGERVGIKSLAEALALARERELDLALVAPDEHPPIVKIIDYGKYLYEQKRQERKQKSAGKSLAVKGIRLGLRIGEHDLMVKVNQAQKFLEKGHKIRIELQFRGREVSHSDLGMAKIKDFASRLAEIGKIDELPRKLGMRIFMTMSPKK